MLSIRLMYSKFLFVVLLVSFISGYVGADTYERHVSYLNSYLSQIRSKESHIRDLVKKKNHTTNNKELEQIIKEIVVADKELQGIKVRYEEELNMVKYKFPEKGEQTKRQYQRIKDKNFEQFESEASQEQQLEKKLEKTKKNMATKLEMPKGKEKIEVRDVDIKKPVKTRQERQEDEDEKIIMVK